MNNIENCGKIVNNRFNAIKKYSKILSHIKEQMDDSDTQMEKSHRKFLCQLAAQSGRPKSPVHKAAKLSELHTYSYLRQDNATDHTENFSVTS
jgi:hypothetical protein